MEIKKWHEKVVDQSALNSIERLKVTVSKGFYLAGGTALALRIGHRISLDFDFFSENEKLEHPARKILIHKLKQTGPLEVREEQEGTLHLILEKTFVSFFYYPYPLLRSDMESWRGVLVAHLEDIAAMKMSAILGRGTKKDFIDAYFLVKQMGLKTFLECGKKRYQEYSDFFMQCMKSLTYFKDAEKDPMPKMLQKVTWETVKNFFIRELPVLLRKQI